MIRIHLDDATRSRLNALRRTDLPATARDRIEMIFLSDAGWSPPRIAAHLGYHPQTVRDRLCDFTARGTDALFPGRPGPAPDAARRREVTEDRRRLLAEDRTWTSRGAAPRGSGFAPRAGGPRGAPTAGSSSGTPLAAPRAIYLVLKQAWWED